MNSELVMISGRYAIQIQSLTYLLVAELVA